MRSTGKAISILTELASADVALLSDVDIRTDLLDLIRVINVAQTALARRVGSFQQRDLAGTDRSSSAKAWLRTFGRLSAHTAGSTISRAELLDRLPAMSAAAQRGTVSVEHLAKVVALADEVGIAAVVEAETELTEFAATVSPEHLRKVCTRVKAAVRTVRPTPDPKATRARRGLTLGRSGDMVRISGLLELEAGAAVRTAIDTVAEGSTGDDARTPSQRRADALVALVGMAVNRDRPSPLADNPPEAGPIGGPQAGEMQRVAPLVNQKREGTSASLASQQNPQRTLKRVTRPEHRKRPRRGGRRRTR
jgi:Domain of unknown function (DUF222)